jgi:hypothetical protein
MQKKRSYMAVMAGLENLELLAAYNGLMGFDSIHDLFPISRFKYTQATVMDLVRRTRRVVNAIMSSESETDVAMQMAAIRLNLPCSNPKCAHPVKVYVVDLDEVQGTGNGWFTVRPCSPMYNMALMIDKHRPAMNCMVRSGGHFYICDFHELQAGFKKLASSPRLQLFAYPLLATVRVRPISTLEPHAS